MKLLRFLLLLPAVLPLSARADNLQDLVNRAPLIKPQADGVVYLNSEAAALVRHDGDKGATLLNDGGGILHVLNGSINDWDRDNELPYWRIELPKAGRYEVVLTHATNINRQSAARFSFDGAQHHEITSRIESTGGWDIYGPSVMGEVDLDAGKSIVEFRPTAWTDARWIIHLTDIRLVPAVEVGAAAPGIHALLDKLGVNANPQVVALQKEHEDAVRQIKALEPIFANRDFAHYTDYHQFFQYDDASEHLSAARDRERNLARELEKLQETKAAPVMNRRLTSAERARLAAYFAAEKTFLDAGSRVYAKAAFTAPAAGAGPKVALDHKPLLPTGHYEELPMQQIDTTLPAVRLRLAPAPDAAERMARFAARDNDEGIAALCRQFYAAIDPKTPGLESFARAYAAGHYRAALDAYRAYFFAKLADPEKYGAVTPNILFEMVRDTGRGELLFRPNPTVLDDNMHNLAVGEVQGKVVTAEVGPPGAVWWAPNDLRLPDGVTGGQRDSTPTPYWNSPEGQDVAFRHEFFRKLTYLPDDAEEYAKEGFFPALLFSYTVSGNKAHLQRWCEYVDDWTMNATRDEENCSWSPRAANELEPQQVRCLLNLMRIMEDERPAFVRDFDSATLARLLLRVQDNYAPYLIRAQRAELSGWGIVGLDHELNAASFLHEFRASRYFARESWRLWNINPLQHNTLDGENIEAWDTGHDIVTTYFCEESVPYAKFPPETSKLEVARFWDQIKVGMRTMLVHISPAGFYWPLSDERIDFFHNDLRNRWLKPQKTGRFPIDLIAKEPGARQRIDMILNGGKPGPLGPPERFSDFSPYGAMAYLRDSWQPGADYLILQNFRDRSGAISDCARGMYDVSAGGRPIFEGQSLTVDGKPDNRYWGKPRTGGKTDYCAEAGRHVVTDRFYTSPAFDLAEATQDSPYAQIRTRTRDIYHIYTPTADGLDDPSPITDVLDHRQIFHVRGAGVWIISDRIENKGTKPHDYAQFFTLPVRLHEDGMAKRVRLLEAAHYPLVEASGNHVRTANPGYHNVSAYFVSPAKLTFANRQESPGKYETFTTSALDTMAADLAAGKKPEQVAESDGEHPYGVAWSGAGNQSLVTVLYTRQPDDTIDHPYAKDLSSFEEVHGQNGATGCHFTTPSGAEVWFQAGPEKRNAVAGGPISGDAEALLVVRQGGKTHGLILGGRSLQIGGKPVVLHNFDGEFSLGAQGQFVSVGSVHRPIDTVQVLPAGDVFTDHAEVSFSIPTQDTSDIDFRYTLDGSDPTLASRLYDKPFTISQTTLVKVRPFRKGLKTTPWSDCGTETGAVVPALFRKQAPLPAVAGANLRPGLNYHYFEDAWARLMANVGFDGVLTPKATGSVKVLLDSGETAGLRKTDRSYALRYDGYIKVPATGCYAFYAPEALYDTTMDSGYDLRVWVDGREWYPTPAIHSENVWNVALARGLHTFSVAYVDYRWKTFRNDYWMPWKPEEMWKGTTPTLEVSGPGMARAALPTSWLFRSGAAVVRSSTTSNPSISSAVLTGNSPN